MITVFVLDKKCNLNCEFCICKDEKELTTEDVKNKLDSCEDTVIFTGGEPLLRDDINELCKYAKERNLKVGINTNGILINRLNLELVDFVNIPLDGREEAHNKLRGKGHYRFVMEALEKLKQNDVETRITTIATKINLEEIKQIPNIIQEYSNITLWRIFKFKDNQNNGNQKYSITEEEFIKLKNIKTHCQIEFVNDIDNFKEWKKVDSSGSTLIQNPK